MDLVLKVLVQRWIELRAKYAYLVDKNIRCIKIINKNISNLGIENIKVFNLDYKKALNSISEKIDIIFLDPPYKTDYIGKSIELVEKLNLLSDKGIIICESDDLNKIVYSSYYTKVKEKKYGDKYIVLLKKNIC